MCIVETFTDAAGSIIISIQYLIKESDINTENGVKAKHDMACSISCRNIFKGHVMEFVNSRNLMTKIKQYENVFYQQSKWI